jgi:hypothetical protein
MFRLGVIVQPSILSISSLSMDNFLEKNSVLRNPQGFLVAADLRQVEVVFLSVPCAQEIGISISTLVECQNIATSSLAWYIRHFHVSAGRGNIGGAEEPKLYTRLIYVSSNLKDWAKPPTTGHRTPLISSLKLIQT